MATSAPYDSILAARYLQALAAKQSYAPNATQLQKLLYIAYGTFLAQTGEALLSEHPQAWPYGPVFPKVQKKVDTSVIPSLEEAQFEAIKADTSVTALFERIIGAYKGFTAKQLSDWSHSKDSPWERTMKEPGAKWSAQISNQYIKEYFTRVNV